MNLRWGQQLVFDGEWLNLQVHLSDALVGVELAQLSDPVQLSEHGLLDSLILSSSLDRCKIRWVDVLLENLGREWCKGNWVNTEDGHQESLVRVSVHETLGKKTGVGEVDVLETLWGDVLSLCELEDVLNTINDLEAATAVDLGDITGAEPAILSHSLLGLLLVAVVTLEERGRAHEKLTTWVWLVGSEVVHVWDGHQADLSSGGYTTTVSGGEIVRLLDETHGVGFSESVTLPELVAKSSAEELVESWIQWCGSRNHAASALETESGLELWSEYSVVQEVLVSLLSLRKLERCELGGNGAAAERTFDSWCLESLCADCGTESVVETWDGDKAGWLQDLHIIDKAENITTEVTDGRSASQSTLLSNTLVNVSQWKIRDDNVVGGSVGDNASDGGSGNGVTVSENDTLWIASGTGSVVNGDGILWAWGLHWCGRLSTSRLNISQAVNGDAELLGNGVKKLTLGVSWLVVVVEGVQADNHLQGWEPWGELQEGWDMRKGGDDAGKSSMVDDVLGGIWAESIVDGNSEESLRHASEIWAMVSTKKLKDEHCCNSPVICHSGLFWHQRPTPYFSPVTPISL